MPTPNTELPNHITPSPNQCLHPPLPTTLNVPKPNQKRYRLNTSAAAAAPHTPDTPPEEPAAGVSHTPAAGREAAVPHKAAADHNPAAADTLAVDNPAGDLVHSLAAGEEVSHNLVAGEADHTLVVVAGYNLAGEVGCIGRGIGGEGGHIVGRDRC
jgi:hypothetical protein